MQQYLTLEEAAKYLQMPPDELREMAKKKTVRAFQDRGTWRFRSQDVEELARVRGLGSDAALQLGEARKTPPPKKVADSQPLPADFALEDEEVPIGREKPTSSSGPASSKSGPRSPKPGSDSDVRLVMDTGSGVVRSDDSEVKFDQPASSSKSPSSARRKQPGSDSGVRLVPPEQPMDSDVKLDPSGKGSSSKLKSPSDSDIRLHEAPPPKKKGPDAGVITEEIDLDAEAARLAEKQKPGKAKPTQVANLPTQSPFELSEPDLELEEKKASKPGPSAKKKDKDSSSDFELIAFDSSKSPVELGSGEIPLLQGDEEVSLGSEVRSPKTGNSGINLQEPADSGISLEEGGSDDMIEFELNLDSGQAAKPGKQPPAKAPQKPAKPPAKQEAEDSSSEFELSLDADSKADSSSEFELSLDADSSSETDSSSEFELSLEEADVKAKGDESSDSEFELTLDDEGGLAVEEEAGDIFEETSFDVPPIEDESGSEAVALSESSETDLEGSDFEISLDDDSTASGERKESQVVNLEDEEEADDAAATVAKPRKTASKSKAAAAALRSATASDEDVEVEVDEAPVRKRAAVEDEEEDEEVAAAPAVAAEWGPLPAILLFPTVIVLFVVGLMGFEILRGMWGFHRSAPVGRPVVDAIARSFDLMPKQ